MYDKATINKVVWILSLAVCSIRSEIDALLLLKWWCSFAISLSLLFENCWWMDSGLMCVCVFESIIWLDNRLNLMWCVLIKDNVIILRIIACVWKRVESVDRLRFQKKVAEAIHFLLPSTRVLRRSRRVLEVFSSSTDGLCGQKCSKTPIMRTKSRYMRVKETNPIVGSSQTSLRRFLMIKIP